MAIFTHLHLHSQYSILDGAVEISSLMKRLKELNMTSVAVTDHGNMYGMIDFYLKAKEYNIKPIFGCEMYVAEGSRFEKKGREDRSGWHLILLAKTKEGYENLCKLSSLGFIEGYYYTARIDKELLRKYSKGLIAMSACLGGEIPEKIKYNEIPKAEEALKEYLDIFGEDFYLEIMRHGIPEQDIVNPVIIDFARKYNVKLIASNDVHFINAEDSESHKILVWLNTGSDIENPGKLNYTGNEYLKSTEEMSKLFVDVPDAIENTQEIVDKIEEFDITRKVLLPSFPIPENYETADDFLRYLTYEGAKTRYANIDDPELIERLEYELRVVKEMGFAGYFLIVQDFINEARKMGVSVGPGRGSAAGSVIAYCTGITTIDPIKYNLLFERFLNPERVSMPDIDVDFDDLGRQKVLDYVTQKYGKDKVAQIITFGSMAARSAIRDVARVIKLPLNEADRLAKLVPGGPDVKLKTSYDKVPELKDAVDNGSDLVKKSLLMAAKLEGSIRHYGTHACGVIIGADNLINLIPIMSSKDSDLYSTQFEGKFVEMAGMLKMDFLGLKTLSIINEAINNIKKKHNIVIDIEKISYEDEITYKLFQRGDTIGIFQFESPGMREYLKELKPTDIEDLIAMNALYRPGPMNYIPVYISRKHGREKVDYPHPLLEKILKPTYGIMVYQEQIMQTAQLMGGYSLGSADILRRAMGKKKPEEMEKQKSVFISGAIANGIDKTIAEEVFETMDKFALYGFNRSHSAAYAVLAYQTGYLKAHYPAEFMAAVLTHNLNDISQVTNYMEETRKQNIPILGPDVNESNFNFFVNNKGEIRFGLGAIKGVGEAAVQNIVEEREKNGLFTNIFDMANRINLRSCNKRCFEAMALSGALDTFPNSHRAQYFYQSDSEDTNFIDKIIKHANNVQLQENSMQGNLFGDSVEVEIKEPPLPVCDEWSKLEKLKKEREVIGFYISGHPLDDNKIEIESFCNVTLDDLKEPEKHLNKELNFAAIVGSSASKLTKTNKPYTTALLEDYSGSLNITLFNEDHNNFKDFLNKESIVYIKAKFQLRYGSKDNYELKVGSVQFLGNILEKLTKAILIRIPLANIDNDTILQLSKIITSNKGTTNVKFILYDNAENISIELMSRQYFVSPLNFIREIKEKTDYEYRIVQ